MKIFTLFVFFLLIKSVVLFGQPFNVGDKVEAWNVAWYKATILQTGSGDKAGYYMVHYDDYSSASDQWVAAKNIRSRKVAKEPSTAAGPRAGKYNVLSYFTNNPIRLGHFTLINGNKYSFYDNGGNLVGSGTYAYDSGEKNIVWQTGPFKDKWEGKFSISREGKTHSIALRRGTVGSNSTDSK